MTTIPGKLSDPPAGRPLTAGEPARGPAAQAALPPIMLSRCSACGHHASLSPAACVRCGGQMFDAVAARGHGTVRARSEVWRAPDAFWRAHVPYTLVLVRLDEGPVLMGHASGDIAIGDPVSASVATLAGRQVLAFRRHPPDGSPTPAAD